MNNLDNNLRSVEKMLRSFAKKCKDLKYTRGLLFSFLMSGAVAQAVEKKNSDDSIESTKKQLVNSIGDMKQLFKEAKRENNKLIKGSNLELIQLMEQGDHVVKSPWSSWQYGMNYFYSEWRGSYKGKGDKKEKYPFEGKFTRGNWWSNNVSPDSEVYSRLAVNTIGNADPTSSLSNNRNGLNYGLVGTMPVPDKGQPLIIDPTININTPILPNLNVNPTVITPNINFSIPPVTTVTFAEKTLPDIRPNVFNPPALDQVSTGFAQDMNGMSFYVEPNVIVNNSSGTSNNSGNSKTTINIEDNGFSVNGAFTYSGRKDNTGQSTTADGSGKVTNTVPLAAGTVDGTWTFDQSNPKPDGSTLVAANGASNVVNSNSTYAGYLGNAGYRTGVPSSPQTVFSFTQYQQDNSVKPGNTTSEAIVKGKWELRNNTTNPIARNKVRTNTVRFMSVNGTHVGSFYDPTKVNFEGELDIYGRSEADAMTTAPYVNWKHMTVAVEQQAASAKESIFTNKGIITLKRESAKPAVNASDDRLGTYLIGFSAMVEDYGQYQPTSGNVINANLYSNITYRPWASEMNNLNTINVESVESIGVDFAEFTFKKNAIYPTNSNPLKVTSWGNKGSLRMYMNTGNINVKSEDPGNSSTVRGSYGIRVPNIFAPGKVTEDALKDADTDAIYYDETIIDGKAGKVNLTGSHNVGISISKKIGGSGTGTNATNDTYAETVQTVGSGPNAKQYNIGTGTMSVYNYQTGKGANGTGLGGKAAGTTADLDNTGRDEKDLIGNIYNLNIVVDGKENVGFLRNYDYMYGNYSPTIQSLVQNDFNIRDTHVNSIDFTSTADGGVLFRTDRYGINVLKNLTVTPGNAYIGDPNPLAPTDPTKNLNKRFNIVMLANGTVNHADTVVPKVKNTGTITINAGGQNVIGLMAYNGGRAESTGDITVTNSDDSIGMVISGTNSSNKISSGTSSSNIKLKGTRVTGIYNNGTDYVMTGGSVKVEGQDSMGIYASNVGTTLATTKLQNGTISAEGIGAVALYARGGSDIELNNTTLSIGNGGLLFYGAGTASDKSQLIMTGADSNATIANGGTAFYVKNASGSPLSALISSASTKTLNLNMQSGSTLMVAEGSGGNVGGELVSNLSSLGTGSITGLNITGTPGTYVPYKATRVPLTVDVNSNLDNPGDAYLKSEFSSSSVTNNAAISGSGAITTPTSLRDKSKLGIAQKNDSGQPRNDVILTNNGTINLSGTGMVGVVGEYTEIYNNGMIRTSGNDSVGILGSNGALAQNNATGTIEIGNSGTGIAAINYLGTTAPTTGTKTIEVVNNGTIKSIGTGSSIGVLAIDNQAVSGAGVHSITLGNGSNIDVSSSAGTSATDIGVGVYSKISNTLGAVTKVGSIIDNGSTITLNKSGVGFFSDGSDITANGGSITTINGQTGKGIFTNKNVNTSKTITLLGDKSIGIHVYNNITDPVNITNSGNITVGDSSNRNDPSMGIYAPNAGNVVHSGNITTGARSLGIYSENGTVTSSGGITTGDEGLAIYKKNGILNLSGNVTAGNNAVAVYGDNNVTVNHAGNVNVGDSSFGFAILDNGTNNFNSTSAFTSNIGSKSVYLYKAGPLGNINSGTSLTSSALNSTGYYAINGAVINNNGNIDFSNSIGSAGAFASNNSTVYNNATITIGKSQIDSPNPADRYYSLGMAAKNGGKIYNNNTINVTGDYGIGMFAEGAGSIAENNGTINLASAGSLKGAYGMYLKNGAYGLNTGNIISGRYSNDASKEGLIGIAVLDGATLENTGTIDIDARDSYGVYIRNGIIKNYGTIRISGTGSTGIRSKNGTYTGAGTMEDAANSSVTATNGAVGYVAENSATFEPTSAGSTQIISPNKVYVDGKIIDVEDFSPGPDPEMTNYAFSNVGIYVDTLGRTNPIDWVDGFDPSVKNDLIIGTEITEITNSKAVKVGKNILTPFMPKYNQLRNAVGAKYNLETISGSLTWHANRILDDTGNGVKEVILAKIPYTDFVSKSENAWNFADGLEQRYGVEAVGTREKQLFNKLNSIGKNEQALLTQAYDEMMGHQYANTQQRIYGTGRLLEKEFTHLKKEWDTKSKQSNKIKTFGMRDEYSTDTAGVIDYTSNAYGFAYLHEDETVKLGNSSGWYAGAVHNRFKFKDIGRSKEDQTMLKLGIFRTMSPASDHNGSLQWTVSGEGYVTRNDMHRKYLVVDEIFNAKSTYNSYGLALKNELGYNIRTSERTSIRPYGSLKLEYGRTGDIEEKTGEVRLEVKGNDYYSIRPELGVEFTYRQPMAVKTTFVTTLGLGYENELGKVGNVGNKARVNYTNADWFNIPSEKDDRRGNFKADLNIGVENQRFGVTVNGGYDTKGKNIRGGIGFRAIY